MQSFGRDILAKSKKNRRQKKSIGNVAASIAKEYASVSTAHGLSYICNEEYSCGDRILWILIVILAIFFTVFQMATLYHQWQEDPVITTLDTINYPIKNIQFPAVTICPQGSLENVLESVLFKQLREYIQNRSLNLTTRNKRSNEGSGKHDLLGLSYEEMMNETRKFMADRYPGVKSSPLQLIRIMTSDNPEVIIQNDAIISPSKEKECDESENRNILSSLNQHLNNRHCPEGFELIAGLDCVHASNIKMTHDDATSYCDEYDNSQLLYLESAETFDAVGDYIIKGIHSHKTHRTDNNIKSAHRAIVRIYVTRILQF